MENLSLENIIDPSELDFPGEETSKTKEEKAEGAPNTPEEEEKEEDKTPTSEELFSEEEEEGEEKKENEPSGKKEDDGENADEKKPEEGVEGRSFYAQVAGALVEDGILDGVDDKELSGIKTPDDFADLMERQIQARMDEATRRVNEALSAGVPADDVRRYEGVIKYINSITEDTLTSEDDKGEQLRKTLIYQDLINRGFSKERAEKAVDRSIKAGTDIDDAREALASNKDFYTKRYKEVVDGARRQAEEERAANKRQAEELRDTIMDSDKAFGEITLDKATRRKVYDNIMKPVWKDPDTGEELSEIERYSNEHRVDFLKNVGLLYTLTDGFKNLDKLVKDKVAKERNKGIRDLEKAISHTSSGIGGRLSFASGSRNDPESRFVNFDIDV